MRKLVIAPREAHRNLLLIYRKNDPFCDIKMLSKEDFLRQLHYQCDERALVYLISRYKMDDEQAEKQLALIKQIKTPGTNEKTKRLYELQKELLSNGLLFKNDLFEHELESSDVDLWFYPGFDGEIVPHLKHFNEKKIDTKLSGYQVFETNSEELFFVFNKIRLLLESGVQPEQIAIYGLSSEDELIFKRMSENFGLVFNGAYPQKLSEFQYVKDFLNNIDTMSVDEAFEISQKYSEDPTFEKFKSIIKKFRINESLKEIQNHLYRSKLSKLKVNSVKYQHAIQVVNEPIGPENGYLFITNFLQAKYPTISRNNDYLSDEEKLTCGITHSEIKNTANLGYFSNLLSQNCTIFVSYSKRNSSGDLLKSPLVKALDLQLIKESFDKIYSSKEAAINFTALKDLEFKYSIISEEIFRYAGQLNIPYRQYENTNQPIIHYTDFGVIELSYSSINRYNECPFKYYLSSIVKLDDIDVTFSMILGEIAHNILEHLNEGSFDDLFNKYYKLQEDKLKEYDWIYVARVKGELEKSFNFIKNFESQVENPLFKREQKYVIALDNHTSLTGRIDKLIISGNDSSNISIIDYKTGREEFNEKLIPYGLSLQLPIYSLIAKEEYPDKQILGLFIQKVMMSNSVRSEDDKGDETFQLQGVFLDDWSKLETIDSSLKISDQSDFIKACKISSNGEFRKGNRIKNSQWFDDNAEIARKIACQTSQNIRNNKFDISPIYVDKNHHACTFCPFKDICYRSYKDYRMIFGEEIND